MNKYNLILLLLGAAVSMSSYSAWTPPDITHAGLDVEVEYSAQTGEYTYQYTVSSPSTNTGYIEQVVIDLKTNVDVEKPNVPPSTNDESVEYYVPAAKMVNVGAESPDNWSVGVGKAGVATWVPNGVNAIRPGQNLAGFTLHSVSPPGERGYSMIPIFFASADSPWAQYGEQCDEIPECPNFESFYVQGTTIGPVLANERDFINSSGEISTNRYDFFRFASPLVLKSRAPAGTDHVNMVVVFGEQILPYTFEAKVNRLDITNMFTVTNGGENFVRIPLSPGRNAIQLSVQGQNRTGKGKDIVTQKAKFVVTVEK